MMSSLKADQKWHPFCNGLSL